MRAHDINFKFELYKIISLIYTVQWLKILKCYISIIIFLLNILKSRYNYYKLFWALLLSYLPSYLPSVFIFLPLLVCGF